MSDWTGIPIASYQRLERGQNRNPRLGELANCAFVLGQRLEDLIEDEWHEWSPRKGAPARPADVPAPGWLTDRL